ncbi:MAG: hypothetical protein NTZ09_14150 [Candidatus Hydrogenedentes bacterium]|nr:hypothetical protein [Candidatus Hydrogenedentota bacterium]
MREKIQLNSVKCRIGAATIWEAGKCGLLKPEGAIVEPRVDFNSSEMGSGIVARSLIYKLVPGAGVEPDSSKNETLSHSGRSLTGSGQDASQVGHSQELAQGPSVNEGTLPVLTPTQSRTLGEHNTSITETAVDPELQTVVAGWLKLPEEVRAGIVAMVKAFDPQRES